MKKLITLTTVGLMLFAGSGFAQNDSPTRDGDRERARHFRIPRLAVDNPEIKELLTAFRTASEEFKTKLAGYRTSLSAEGISEEQKTTIKADIRELLKQNRIAQARFRKQVREVLRGLRQDRVTDSEG